LPKAVESLVISTSRFVDRHGSRSFHVFDTALNRRIDLLLMRQLVEGLLGKDEETSGRRVNRLNLIVAA
jgi:hypothetical protein